MHMRKFFLALMQVAMLQMAATSVMAENIAYIAGTNPSQRPADAPVITQVQHDGAWYKAALKGVQEPYPQSLRFLENQGNWFTPFTHAGMNPPYDIRGWHTQP